MQVLCAAATPILLVRPCRRSGAHGKAVTAMLPLASEAPGGPDMLLTASADGTLAVWDPSRASVKGADREMAPRHAFKAHDSGVTVGSTARPRRLLAASLPGVALPRPACALWRPAHGARRGRTQGRTRRRVPTPCFCERSCLLAVCRP